MRLLKHQADSIFYRSKSLELINMSLGLASPITELISYSFRLGIEEQILTFPVGSKHPLSHIVDVPHSQALP